MFLAPLLMSCGNVKVEQPVFADKGSQKSIADFLDGYTEVIEKSALKKEEEMLPSAIVKYKMASKSTNERSRYNKVLYSKKASSSSEREIQIDMENVFASDVRKGSSSVEEKDANKKHSEKTSLSQKKSLQEKKGMKKTYLVEADINAKTFRKVREVEENKTTKQALDMKVRSESGLIGEISSSFLNQLSWFYRPHTEEELGKYKVYQNDKVFTIEFEEKIEEKSFRVNDVQKTETNSTKTEIWQIDLTDGNMLCKHYKHFVTTVEYTDEYEEHAENEIVTTEEEMSEVASYEYTSSIKAKKDNIEGFIPVFNVE